MTTLVHLLLHQPLLPIQLATARGHRHIVGAHNVNEHPFKTRLEDDWAIHWPKGLVVVAVDDDKDPLPYAQNVLFIALGQQLVPETHTVTLSEKPWKPDWAVSPGETIAESLQELGVTPLRLAQQAGLSIDHLDLLLRGQAVLDADTAVRLEHALGINAEFWLNMDAAYQLHRARQQHATQGCTCHSVRPNAPRSGDNA
jgi:addiction module HigA family antidote